MWIKLRLGVQRLFATFPDGLQGFALLVLRVAVAGSLTISGPSLWPVHGAETFCIILAIFLILGLLLPYAAVIGVCAAVLVSLEYGIRDLAGSLFVVMVFSSSGVLGAGAYSLDCWLFGRRIVVIRKSKN